MKARISSPSSTGSAFRKTQPRAVPTGLRAQITELQTWLREAAPTLSTWRPSGRPSPPTPNGSPLKLATADLPEHRDYPCILAVCDKATGPLRGPRRLRDPRPRATGEGHRRHPCRTECLVELGILTEADTCNLLQEAIDAHLRRAPRPPSGVRTGHPVQCLGLLAGPLASDLSRTAAAQGRTGHRGHRLRRGYAAPPPYPAREVTC